MNLPEFHTQHVFFASGSHNDHLLFQQVVNELPYLVHLSTAKDGNDTLEVLNQLADLPDLLILDLDLSIKNGLECLLEIKCTRVVGIQVGKLYFAEIFCFEPMDHGRHRSACTSGKAKEFQELQSARCQTDRHGVRGMQIRSARGGDGRDRGFDRSWLRGGFERGLRRGDRGLRGDGRLGRLGRGFRGSFGRGAGRQQRRKKYQMVDECSFRHISLELL